MRGAMFNHEIHLKKPVGADLGDRTSPDVVPIFPAKITTIGAFAEFVSCGKFGCQHACVYLDRLE